ncbi:MAG: S41 family peptidase [Candidatus Kapabacteria bacterium]|nr:S41 family peptidase [Candidatus Kapabacteria bacterium]
MKRKKVLIYILLVLINILDIDAQTLNYEEQIKFQTTKFQDLLKLATANYLDSVNVAKISEKAFSALLKELDPQSIYYNAETYKSLKQQNTGTIVGVGINIVVVRDTVFVFSVLPNSPADSAGIEAGDKILFINGKSAVGLNESTAINNLNGEINSKLSIISKRGNSNTLFENILIRQSVNQSSIFAKFYLKATKTLYLKSNVFSTHSDLDFKYEIDKITKEYKIDNLVIDIRSNPGGYLDQISNIIGMFLEKDKVIIKSKVTNQNFNVNRVTTKNGEYIGMPLIVIVDSETASAGEILSANVQDYDLGLVIGQNTFGKGSVQNWWEFNDGSAFRLTVAEYLTSSGRPIEKNRQGSDFALSDETKLGLDEKSQNEIKNALSLTGGKTKADIFKSKKGRVIISFGGVLPDKITPLDTLTLLSQVLNNNRTIQEFAYAWLDINQSKIKEKYKNDFQKFAYDFRISDEQLEELHQISLKKNVWNDQMFLTDKEYIRLLLLARIAEAIWNQDAYYYIMSKIDSVFKKAIESINEAKEIAK